MKINRPGDPLSGSTEPLDPRDLQNLVKGERFEAVLSELEGSMGNSESTETAGTDPTGGTRAALTQIAGNADLTNTGQSLTAVRESARYMISSRLSKRFRETSEAKRLIDGLSDYVASDPLLKSKLLSILQKLKPA